MAEYSYKSAGISAQEIGTVKSDEISPTGLSACIVGTSNEGPAFVPLTFGSVVDYVTRFGAIDGSKFGPLAVEEWLRAARSVSYIRVLGVGQGLNRSDFGDVAGAGFTVGEELPNSSSSGYIMSNSFANYGGPLGRTYFLGCFMSESQGSAYFSSAGLQGTGSLNGITNSAIPIIRGIIMAPSGVILRLSSSAAGIDSTDPSTSVIATEGTAKGSSLGSITMFNDGVPKQEFILFLNGYKSGSSTTTYITASFDMQSSNYFATVLNTTASLMQEKGHYLYTHWDIHPTVAEVTGVGVVSAGADAVSDVDRVYGTERSVFLLTSSLSRNVGSSTVPNYESFTDRFSHAKTPWFISQKFHGIPHSLFRIHSLSDGSGVSNKYKITIKNITPTLENAPYQYGSFDLLVKSIDDPDNETVPPLESHLGLTLDPESDKYICKVIGDVNAFYDFDRPVNEQKLVIEGNYPNNSRFIRVEVAHDVAESAIPPAALPVGFRGISHTVTSGSAPLAPLSSKDSIALLNANYLRNAVQPPLPLRTNNVAENVYIPPSTLKSWGVIFDHVGQNNNDIKQKRAFLDGFTGHYPDHFNNIMNFSVADNAGYLDTPQNGILDCDRFCHNLFSLENIRIITGSNGSIEKPEDWNLASYVRNGIIFDNDAEKSRRIKITDFLSGNCKNYLHYSVIMQGGFDGVNIFDDDEARLTSAAATADMADVKRGRLSGPTISTYKKSIEIAGNSVNVDFSIFAIPGMREPVITDNAIEMVETRYDALYIMDLEDGSSAAETVALASSRGVNSSFVASYYPDVIIKRSTADVTELTVPPSVAVLGAISLNDSIGYPWFAPAGVTRGLLRTATKTVIPLKEADINLLYSNDINPLYATTNIKGSQDVEDVSGVVIWGQKTMQRAESALDRINVRRLLLEIRRIAREAARGVLFEPNRSESLARLNIEITNKLSFIQASLGLDGYKVVIDSTTTSKTDVENNTVRGKVYVKPKKSEDFISVDFSASNTSE